MSQEGRQKRSLADLLALLLAFTAAVIAFLGALVTYIGQEKVSVTPLWPLPGLVLAEWVLLGVAGFITAFFSLRKKKTGWFRATWVITGAFIPLIILGAFFFQGNMLIILIAYLVGKIILGTAPVCLAFVRDMRRPAPWQEEPKLSCMEPASPSST